MAKLRGKLVNLQEKTIQKQTAEGIKDVIYWILTLGERDKVMISVWDSELMKGINLNDILIVDYVSKGKYNNATAITKDENKEEVIEEMIEDYPEIMKEDFDDYEGGHSSGAKEFDKSFIVNIKGKSFVRFNGLLDKAHASGLIEAVIENMNVNPDGKSAWCIGYVTFKDGKKIYGSGSANELTLGSHLKGYAVEMAATRMFARCLRNALNIDFVSVEEINN